MSTYTFELQFGPLYRQLVKMCLPISFVYIILLALPLIELFSVVLDYFVSLNLPQEYVEPALLIVIAMFVALTLAFFIFAVPFIITGVFRILCPPTDVRPTGIRACTLDGRMRKVIWSEITHVEKVRYFGLNYLKVSSKNDPTLWVPLFYEDQDIFAEAILSFAPPENPLRPFMQEQVKVSASHDEMK